MTDYEVIERWAEGHGLTLSEAVESGVRVGCDGEIVAPPIAWSWSEGYVELWRDNGRKVK